MNTNQHNPRILGFGAEIPSGRLPNTEMEKLMDTSSDWIEQNVGIKTRAIITDNEDTISMGVAAGQKAIAAAAKRLAAEKAVEPDEIRSKIRAIVCATNSPPEIYPSSGVKIQAGLGLENCFAFDVQAGCTGWLYALQIGTNHQRGLAEDEYVLVIGTDALSTEIDYTNRVGVLFGDGAGAALLGAGNATSHIVDFHLGSVHSPALYLKSGYDYAANNYTMYKDGGRPEIPEHHPEMNGKIILKLSLEKTKESFDNLLKKTGTDPTDIKWFVPHQTNINVVKKFCSFIDYSFEKVPLTLPELGSISSAGLPTHMTFLLEKQDVQPGDLVLFCAYGAGFTYGSALVRY